MRKHFSRNIAVAIAVSMAIAPASVPAQAAVKLSVPGTTVSKGDKINLDVIGANEISGKYTTSNKSIAAVTKKGVVTAKKEGAVKISWKKGKKKYTCKIKVVKTPGVGRTKFTLTEGQTKRVAINKYGNKNLSVTWGTSDKKIATAKGGKIIGISKGQAIVTAKIKGYSKTWTKKIAVTVKKKNGTDNDNKPTEEPTAKPTGKPTAEPMDDLHKGYHLVWQDEFNGTKLNRDDWNIELHEPGWVNAELQEYVDSEKNIYMEDGKLVLKPIKTVGSDGSVSYTSGRVNTQDKHNFKYGLFEASVRVPKGQGFLPAFWMMPSDENLYGQWPRCGELDIMEVMGQDTKKSYGTIHYGNPHSESQGTCVLENGNFSDGYHTFSAEWEPGKIKWYVDGKLIHTENDWYSATQGQGEITYPAPFDQPFYLIFNLAVGGNWVGNPDEATDFDNAAYKIDYVRVYQKESYDEKVQKPVKEVILREPDANGNYINNGNFSTAESLMDEKDWIFLTALGGEAVAEIKDNKIMVNTVNEGTVDYSIQLVQPNLPMKRGGKYQLTFDAYADSPRTMKVDVSAPNRGYARYLADTTVELTNAKKTYTYGFTMTDSDDANGRLEYNLGVAGSTAGVHISNVSLIKTEEINLDTARKTVLADGNYVYNGAFQEGTDRMGYWDVAANGAEVSVTNTDNIRRLKVTIPEGASADQPVRVSQSGLAIQDGNNYVLGFDAEGSNDQNISVTVAGKKFEALLAGAEKAYSYKFKTETGLTNKEIVFEFNSPGTFYLDNIRIDEDSLIKNGSFNAGFSGYEPFVDGSADATYVVDSLSEENAADFAIQNTGDAAWKIQLKQNNIELKNGQWYKLSFDAKSSVDRKIMFAIQRDGSIHGDDWTPYSGEKIIELGGGYKKYELAFQMTEATDLQSVLSISMGAVDGKQITEKHRICIDNILLEKTEGKNV